jgi:selenide,water dikinase
MVHEAGALLVGGHTITDEEVKFGLAVTGRVDPARCLTNALANPGDVLLLTKPIGTGILATHAKRGRLDENGKAALVASMTTLNAHASRAALAVGARCATDVTGFGLLGHALHIARASNVTVRIRAAAVPVLPGTLDALRDGARTGGAERNATFVAPFVSWGDVNEELRAIVLDPQTSGGLLVALAPEKVDDFRARMPAAVVIGNVSERGTHALVVA